MENENGVTHAVQNLEAGAGSEPVVSMASPVADLRGCFEPLQLSLKHAAAATVEEYRDAFQRYLEELSSQVSQGHSANFECFVH